MVASDAITLGSKVTLLDGDGPFVVRIVEDSADPGQGELLSTSPLGLLLLGRRPGEKVRLPLIRGYNLITIKAVE